MKVLQSWRANCDVKVLLYDTDPYHPDMKEISNVIDYIVAYTCKGHITLNKEQKLIVDMIKRYAFIYVYLIHFYFVLFLLLIL